VFDTRTVLLLTNYYCFRFKILAINISFYCTGFEILSARNYLDYLGFSNATSVFNGRCQKEPYTDNEGCIQELFKRTLVSVTRNHKILAVAKQIPSLP
jgi:hypothetical protein